MVHWSFRWKRLRPLGLSRTATLIAWEPAGLRELAGRVASVMDGLDGRSGCQLLADGFQGGGSELTQDVVGAARELARDRQRRSGVGQSTRFERLVVVVVRAGWPARG